MLRNRMPAIALLLLAANLGGCVAFSSNNLLNRPYYHAATFTAPRQSTASPTDQASLVLAKAESLYAEAVDLEQAGETDCLDRFWQVAQLLWPQVSQSLEWNKRPHQLYQSAVGKLLTGSQQLDKFNPLSGIATNRTTIPIRYHAIVWPPSECRRFSVVGDYRVSADIDPKRQAGLGVPILGQHECNQPFIYRNGLLTATAVVRPNDAGQFALEIINSTLVRRIQVQGREVPLALDLTAPIAFLTTQSDHAWLTGFIRPGDVETTTGLQMIEPYQPGKIPVILIHGLASDPLTWAVMANELFVHEDLQQNFQFWVFSYPTGKPFPAEAARLRQQLVELRQLTDPRHRDPALDRTVLIGHSMGGLISKMQITTSGQQLEKVAFGKSIDELELPDDLRQRMQATFRFEPSQQISRVIFMGTPHRGSKIASNPIGRLASHIVKEPMQLMEDFNEIVRQNGQLPGLKKIPTSVDLLRPSNRLLQAIADLPVAPQIAMHTVLGTSHGGKLGIEKSDGVVPVSSAQHPNTITELHVDASHTRLHHTPEAVAEVVRILRGHLSESIAHPNPAFARTP